MESHGCTIQAVTEMDVNLYAHFPNSRTRHYLHIIETRGARTKAQA